MIEPIDLPLEAATRMLNHGPVVLVSTTDGTRGNVSTVAWCSPCGKEPPRFALTIGKSHRTYKNLLATGTAGLCIPGRHQTDLAMYCGTESGDQVDKLKDLPIPTFQGRALPELPLVQGCHGWLECKLVNWSSETPVVILEAVRALALPGAMNRDNTWNIEDFPILHHLGGSTFISGDLVIKV